MDSNIDNADGVNVTHDGGLSAEARDVNLDNYVVDENNVNDEDKEFQVGDYDDNKSGDSESSYGDSDTVDGEECYMTEIQTTVTPLMTIWMKFQTASMNQHTQVKIQTNLT